MKKIIYVVTVDWYFVSHRLSLAKAALAAGFEVVVVTGGGACSTELADAGFRVIPLHFHRASLNPFRAISIVRKLAEIYRSERPDVVHHVAIKPVLLGSLSARLAGVPGVVNLIAGRGWIFTSRSLAARMLRPVISPILRRVVRSGRLVVQNPDDMTLMKSLGVADVTLVRGSGVDPSRFVPREATPGEPVVMFVGRMVIEKGVREFVQAAAIVKRRTRSVRFVLLGGADSESRSHVPREVLESWAGDGTVEYWGESRDVAGALAQAHIACLPSYGEGIPKALLEAAACGLPLIATDVPGCRDVVQHEVNGLLVPPRDAGALADALTRLIDSPELRRTMGARSRSLVLEKFTDRQVIDATLAIYREVLAGPVPAKHPPSVAHLDS